MSDNELLDELYSISDGFCQAHMRGAELGDRVLVACMRAHHTNVNRLIADRGGDPVELADLESLMKKEDNNNG